MTYKIMIVLLLLLIIAPSAVAQDGSPVQLPNTETFVLSSSQVGDDYLIHVALPWNYDPAGAYGVLYLLDPNFLFGSVTEQTRLMSAQSEVPPLIVVGIGYLLDGDIPLQVYRGRDYIPGLSFANPGSEGPAAFLKFITEELVPLIDRTYATLPTERALMGYSFSGEFTLYAFVNATDTFNRYLAISPALPWSEGELLRYTATLTPAAIERPTQVIMSVGDGEGSSLTMRRYAALLEGQQFDSLSIFAIEIEDVTHYSAFGIGLIRSLQTGFRETRQFTDNN